MNTAAPGSRPFWMADEDIKGPSTMRLMPSVPQARRAASPSTPHCGCLVGHDDMPDLSFTIDLANPDLDEKD